MRMGSSSWRVCRNAFRETEFFTLKSKLITSERVKNGNMKFCKVA